VWFNLFMIPILKSPLHFLISESTILITYRGKKSGKQYQVPVNYLAIKDRLLTTSFRHRIWWRNLRGGVGVTVRLKGKNYRARAEAVEDPEKVEALLIEYYSFKPEWAKYSQIKVDETGQADLEDILRAANDKVVVVTRLAR
jgi:deazaflavin-dependent oxidoreductase (nitroreductase family)